MAFEYLVVEIRRNVKPIQDDLDHYGRQGWELVGFVSAMAAGSTMDQQMVFKRLRASLYEPEASE